MRKQRQANTQQLTQWRYKSLNFLIIFACMSFTFVHQFDTSRVVLFSFAGAVLLHDDATVTITTDSHLLHVRRKSDQQIIMTAVVCYVKNLTRLTMIGLKISAGNLVPRKNFFPVSNCQKMQIVGLTQQKKELKIWNETNCSRKWLRVCTHTHPIPYLAWDQGKMRPFN